MESKCFHWGLTLVALLLPGILSSCTTLHAGESSTVAQYRAFLNGLPVDAPDSIGKASDRFDECFAGRRQIERDAAFLAFRDFYYIAMKSIDERFQREWPGHRDAAETLVSDIYRNGLAFWEELGGCFVCESDSFLVSTFASQISAPLREFLLIRQKELREPYDNDAVLEIPFKRLSERCLDWERYLERFADSPLRECAEFYYREYLETLLLGMPNSPVLDNFWSAENKAPWLAEIATVYEYLVRQHRKTRTARIIGEYYPLVKSNAFSRTPEVEKFLEDHRLEYTQDPLIAEKCRRDRGFPLTSDEFRKLWEGVRTEAQNCNGK